MLTEVLARRAAGQRDDLFDAAICVLGDDGIRVLTRRVVDAAEEVAGVGCDGGVVFGAEGPEVVHAVAVHFGAGVRAVVLSACQ